MSQFELIDFSRILLKHTHALFTLSQPEPL
jgi:hypothetical protein